jgi:putative acyl-CoA dehydrogenase
MLPRLIAPRLRNALGDGCMNWQTHEVTNQFDELADYNLFLTDPALREGVDRAGATWSVALLRDYGARIGSAESYRMADEANRCTPELKPFDRRGRRIDQVEFHPSWHALLAGFREAGFVSMAFATQRPGRWTTAAAGSYLHSQVEAGTMCPASMTQACIPLLQREPALWLQLREKLYSTQYDARDVPLAQKHSAWVGMGMTEKQGGSDVRSNTTTATPVTTPGRGAEYLLRGHKWFFSAPMCDAHLVVARSDAGHSCFYVPRWRPDGTRNAVRIQRLKGKLGNRSNASGEVEFLDAWGVMMGEEGRGIRTIIEMATTTRLSCVIASAGILRQCLVQALGYARRRKAFGRTLAAQPLMRSVLADLALESEAATALMLRLALAFENADRAAGRAWMRILTPAAKFWVCKRAIELSGEAMEVFGGNGYVEESALARMYREAPVNSIWEGSGNVMCLDAVRALQREPGAAAALFEELERGAAGETVLHGALQSLRRDLLLPDPELEARGRRFVQGLVLVAQACLLRAHAPPGIADAFIATRFDGNAARVAGAIDTRNMDVDALLERAFSAP